MPDVLSMCDFTKEYTVGSGGVDYETRRLYELGYEVVGIDFCEESLKIIRSKNPNVLFILRICRTTIHK